MRTSSSREEPGVSALQRPYASRQLGGNRDGGYVVALFKQRELPPDSTPVFRIGQYKWNETGRLVQFKSPSVDSPISKVTLSTAATERLIEFLCEHFAALKIGVHRFSDLSAFDGDIAQVFKLALQHVEQGVAPEDLSTAIEIRLRRNALVEMRQLLGESHDERFWQKWLKERNWIVGGYEAIVLAARDITVEEQTDYLLHSDDGYMDIVEIKCPSDKFWNDKKDDRGNYVPSRKLINAITQGSNYALSCEEMIMNNEREQRRIGAPVARPNVLVLLGRSDHWDKEHFRAQRLLNSTLHGIRAITYDQLISRCERVLPPASDPI